jgi:hypothetical protein
MESIVYEQMDLDGYISDLHKLYAAPTTAENLRLIEECEVNIEACNTYMDEQIRLKLERTTLRLENELKEALEFIEKKREEVNIARRELALYHDCLGEDRQPNMAFEWSSSPTALERIAELEEVEKVAMKEHRRAKSNAMYVLLKKNAHTAHCNFHATAKLIGVGRESIAHARWHAPLHPTPCADDFQGLTRYWNSMTDELIKDFYRGF